MKSKRGVDSKAGTLKMENSAAVLRNLISKSASMLLIAMAGFGMMSFTQDDTSVNSVDTNLSVNKEIATETAKVVTDENCCVALVSKPGDELKKALSINMPHAKAISFADQENSRAFVADVKERSLWNVSLAGARAKADREMAFNFELSKLIPAANAVENADEIMVTLLTEDVILKSTGTVVKNASVADAEMASQFMTDHFSININADAAQADANVMRAFEKANLPSIALPSVAATAKADAEMALK
ncbi:MAG: hypothetical protein ACTHMM_08640 [Agriterribacter sp.]